MLKTNKKQIKTTTKQKILLILFGIFLALVVLELSLRIGGFVVSSYQRSGNEITDDLGNTYRILCLGESTTANIYGDDNSWPAQLEIILNNKSSGIKFKVFNEGVSGTNTAFILSRLENNLDKYDPDTVITMMGINDIGLIFKYKKNIMVKISLFFRDLRIYKLSRLLLAAWKNKTNDAAQNINIIKEYEMFKSEDKEKAMQYLLLGKKYRETGSFEEAEDMFKKFIEVNTDNDKVYAELGWLYKNDKNLEEAEYIFKKTLEINPDNNDAYIGLGEIYKDNNNLEEAEYMFKKAIEINPNKEGAYIGLGQVYYKQGISSKEIESFLKENGFSFRITANNSFLDTTKYHYHQLYNELSKRGVKYIAMVYPTVSVNEFKNIIFNENEDVIFVSNEENFKEALETGKYEDYFVDKFAGNFGHCTLKGNKLIAENVAEVILKELNTED